MAVQSGVGSEAENEAISYMMYVSTGRGTAVEFTIPMKLERNMCGTRW